MTLMRKKGNQQNRKAPITTARVFAAFNSFGKQNLLDFPLIVIVIFLACVRDTYDQLNISYDNGL